MMGRGKVLRSGFTLVEVLISLGIMATTFGIMWGSFATSNRMRDIATTRYDRLRAVHAALQRMQREISMSFVSKIGQNPTNERMEETYVTAFIGQHDRLDFSNFAHMRTRADEVSSEQAEIAYYLRSERGRDGRLQDNLVRREQAPIDGDPEEGGTIFVLLEDVKSLEFDYWRPDREIAGDAWEREWDSRDLGVGTLPPRVRVTIEVQDPLTDRKTWEFAIQSEIHLTTPIGFVAQGIVPTDTALPDDSNAPPTDDDGWSRERDDEQNNYDDGQREDRR